MFNGVRLSFYPDFSSEVQKRRACFSEVKKHLQKLQAPYAMGYPARFQVHLFEHATNASAWLNARRPAAKEYCDLFTPYRAITSTKPGVTLYFNPLVLRMC